jgi:hypothetical protein
VPPRIQSASFDRGGSLDRVAFRVTLVRLADFGANGLSHRLSVYTPKHTKPISNGSIWRSGQRIVGVTAHVRSPCRRHNDVNRRYHARRIHRAAKRPIKPASWNLGLQYNHAMRRDRAMKKYLVIYGRNSGRRLRLPPLTGPNYLRSTLPTRAARSNHRASPAAHHHLREFLLKHCEALIRPTQSGKIAAGIHGVLRDLTTNC